MRRPWVVRALLVATALACFAFFEGRIPSERALIIRLDSARRDALDRLGVECKWPGGLASGAQWHRPLPPRLEHRFRAVAGEAHCTVRTLEGSNEVEVERRIQLSTDMVVLPL